MPVTTNLTKAVSDRLRFGGLDKAHLKEMAEVVATLNAGGMSIHDVFPHGIINPDSVIAHAELSGAKLDFLKQILINPRISGIEVFPMGIINPERFRVNVTIR